MSRRPSRWTGRPAGWRPWAWPPDALAWKEPQDIEVLHPLRDGVIADLDAASAMLQGFVRRARLRRGAAADRSGRARARRGYLGGALGPWPPR